MRLRSPLLVAAVLLAFASTVPPAISADKLNLERVTPVPDTEPIPTMDFFRPLLLQQPVLNPSGTHIAAVITAAKDKHQLLVYELKTKKIETVGSAGDKDIYSVSWLNDQRLMFSLGARKMYGVAILAADVGNIDHAYPVLQYYYSRLLSVPPQDRLHPLVWNRYDGLGEMLNHDLGVAQIETGTKGHLVDLLAAGAENVKFDLLREENEAHIRKRYPSPATGLVLYYLTDRVGQLEFCVTDIDGKETLHHLVGDHWEKCAVDLEKIEIVGCGETPGQLVVQGPRQEGKPSALQFMDGVTGTLGDVLLQDAGYDFYSAGSSEGWLYRDPVSHTIVGAMFDRGGPQSVWFNESYRNLQKALEGFFPGVFVRIIGSDEAQKLFLVATFSDRQPVVYSWVDLEKHTGGLIKSSAPWIDPKRMQPENIVKFKTRDGRRLDAYLTLPAGASKSNPPPMVVLPHGGPWVRDSWGFDGEVQFLASRGYAVLQPNYRGSNGYTWMFPEEDKWDFVKMHDDVTDATKAIINAGLVDRDRIAIMGGSFGGYLAIAGVVHEPTLYRCAVTIAGVFDWEEHVRGKKYDQYESSAYGYFMRKLGDPKENKAKFDAISPGRHVDQIRVPVFVSGGKDDTTVEIAQSNALISALDKYHVPHEQYIVGEEGHGMRHLDKQVELYDRIEKFLAKNLAPVKPATPAAP